MRRNALALQVGVLGMGILTGCKDCLRLLRDEIVPLAFLALATLTLLRHLGDEGLALGQAKARAVGDEVNRMPLLKHSTKPAGCPFRCRT